MYLYNCVYVPMSMPVYVQYVSVRLCMLELISTSNKRDPRESHSAPCTSYNHFNWLVALTIE